MATPLLIYFIYLGSKDIYSIFTMCCTIFYFPQNAVYFIILSFLVQTVVMFFVSQMVKFKYLPHIADTVISIKSSI
jgi:hypothetical protein